MKKYFFMKFKINNINKLMFKINECCMNIENTNLHNILSTLISNQASLYSKVSGNLNDIFYVETFDSEPSVNGLYIDHNGESRYWTGIEWEYISNEVSDIIDENSTSGTVPTSKAVYDLVNSRTSGSVSDGVITEINGKIEDVSGNVKTISESLPNYTLKSELAESLNNYALKSELTNSLANYTLKSELTERLNNYALKSELPYDIFYVETFDSEPSVSGLYINHNGESRYWTGSEWEYISNEISDIIDTNSTSGTVPTSKAVYDFVTASLNEFTPSTDTNVREVYYLSGIEFEEAPAVSGIYINSKGESKFWNGTEYEDLSLAVSNEINESSTSGTVSTSKAVYDFVTSSLAQNELSNKEIYYITSFDNLEVSGAGLYIDQDGQSKYWTGTEWELTSVETSNIISSSSTSGTIPTSKAVYDFVTTSLQDNEGSVVNEVFYIESFDNYTPTISGIYIDQNGQSKFYSGSEWEQISNEVVDSFNDSNIESVKYYLPSVSAVYDYVNSKLENVGKDIYYLTGTVFEDAPANIGLYINTDGYSKYWNGSEYEDLSIMSIDRINESNIDQLSGSVPTSKAVCDYVNSKLENVGKDIYYLTGTIFEDAPTNIGLYINTDGQSKYWNGTEYEDLSNEVVDSFNDSNIESVKYNVPSVSAVYNYVNSKLENAGKDIYYLTGTIFEDAPANVGLYINTDGQSKYWNGTEYEDLSIMCIDDIDESNIDQISGTIPTSKAVYDYISERNFGLSKTWKTVSTTSGSYAVVIGNGLQQKVTLTGNITLTPPVLNSTYYSLILQITKTSNQTVSINSTTVLDSSKVGTFQIKWFYDGTNTYRYEPIQVYID